VPVVPRFSTSDGVLLHYLDEGAGPPVVLIAGYGAPAVTWRLQTHVLVTEGFRVISVDRRHTGDSDFPPYGQRMSRQGADVVELVTGLGLERPAVAGSSMGAAAALAAISVFGTSWLGRLCLVDQTPRMVNDDNWSWGLYGLDRAGVEPFVQSFPGTLSPFHAPPPPEALALLASVTTPYPFDGTRDLLRDHTHADWRDVVPRIDIPLLALAGAHSPLWSPQSSRWMAEAAPQGRYAELPNSGHAPHLSEPAAFNAALLAWLRQ
jgi:non-heme chloroperoxidase